MAELLEEMEGEIEAVTLIPSDGGRFEISVNGNQVYSKLKLLRHAGPGEVLGLVKKYHQEHL